MKARGRAAVALAVLGVGASPAAAAASARVSLSGTTLTAVGAPDDPSRCENWLMPDDDADATIVACDQSALDDYAASGYTRPSNGITMSSREGAGHTSGFATSITLQHGGGLSSVRISTTRAGSPAILAESSHATGRPRTAVFPSVPLAPGTTAHLDVSQTSLWHIEDQAGTVLATAAPRSTAPFRPATAPTSTTIDRTQRKGTMLTVSWHTARVAPVGSSFQVLVGRFRDIGRTTRVARTLRATGSRTRYAATFVRRGSDRWVRVRIVTKSGLTRASPARWIEAPSGTATPRSTQADGPTSTPDAFAGIDQCSDWQSQPGTVGYRIVACDQQLLDDHYGQPVIASGPDGLAITDGGRPLKGAPQGVPPYVIETHLTALSDDQVVSSQATRPVLTLTQTTPDGDQLSATFPPIAMDSGTTLHVVPEPGGSWRAVDQNGVVRATAASQTVAKRPPSQVTPGRARSVRVVREHTRLRISWLQPGDRHHLQYFLVARHHGRLQLLPVTVRVQRASRRVGVSAIPTGAHTVRLIAERTPILSATPKSSTSRPAAVRVTPSR
jgi:hypothetical protein